MNSAVNGFVFVILALVVAGAVAALATLIAVSFQHRWDWLVFGVSSVVVFVIYVVIYLVASTAESTNEY